MASEVLEKFLLTQDEIERHTLRCFSWLIETGRIEIKVALMQTALFHMKVWLFREGEDVLAVHGSANMTHAGIEENIEQVAVSKSWRESRRRTLQPINSRPSSHLCGTTNQGTVS